MRRLGDEAREGVCIHVILFFNLYLLTKTIWVKTNKVPVSLTHHLACASSYPYKSVGALAITLELLYKTRMRYRKSHYFVCTWVYAVWHSPPFYENQAFLTTKLPFTGGGVKFWAGLQLLSGQHKEKLNTLLISALHSSNFPVPIKMMSSSALR